MIIWFAMLVPVAAVILMNYCYKHRIAWWECLLPVGASFFLILITKACVETSQTQDTEFWTGYITAALYDEPWDEYVHDTCYRTDDDGNTESYDCSYVDDHGPEWWATDNNELTIKIDEQIFAFLCQKFGNQNFVDMHRSYHSYDGDRYTTEWPGNDETIVAVTHEKTYENRTQASHSIYRFPEVDPEEVTVMDYPAIAARGWFGTDVDKFKVPSILTEVEGLAGYDQANEDLNNLNAKFGKDKQIRIWLLVFGEGTSLADGTNQEAYWGGGNKNELVICVGIDQNYGLQWAHIFSWTEVEELKIKTRDFILASRNQQLDLMKIVRWLKTNVPDVWKRKEFADFSYLSVEPPFGGILLAYILSILASLGTSLFAILNEYDEDGMRKYQWSSLRQFPLRNWSRRRNF